MRLIEKKCPNCGANLEFDENDKSCKCQYCKRSFEIERDVNDLEKFNLIYNQIQKPFKIMFYIPFIAAFIIILIISLVIFFSFKGPKVDNNSIYEEFQDIVKDKELFIKDVNELSNTDIDLIENNASSKINHTAEGVNDASHSFSIDGDITREKIYVLYKEKTNYIVVIFKATYRDFFHQEDRHTVYIPVVYEKIEKNVLSSLGNATIEAPTYYLTTDKSTFTVGYSSFEEAYQETVGVYNEEFTISEK